MLDFEPLGSLFKKAASCINIASLFKVAGREGAYYGDSYDEILRKNNEALGPELVANEDFSNGTVGWTAGNSASFIESNGRAVLTNTAAANGYAYQVIATVPGDTYVVLAMCAGGTAPSPRVFAGTAVFSANLGLVTQGVTGVYMFMFTATTATTWISIANNSTTLGHTFTIDNYSVRKLADYSKLVLFDDPNGTVPVFHPLQTTRGKGLLLDRSKGLVRGAELFNPADFSSGWTLEDGFSPVGASGLVYAAGTGREAYRSVITTPNTYYEVIWNTSAATVNTAVYSTQSDVAVAVYPSSIILGQRRQLLKATGTSMVVRLRTSAASGSLSVDLFSVRELPGNHMSQPTAAARGELSARINLLNSSDNFSNVAWVKTSCTVEGDVITAEASTNLITQIVTLTTPSHVAFTMYVKRGSHDWVRHTIQNGANEIQAWFNLLTGEIGTFRGVGTATSVSASIEPAEDGGYVCALSGIIPGVTSITCISTTAADDLSFTRVAGTRTLRKPDVRLAADAIPSIPSYQAVRSATDYDTEGFPVYWRAQTDDWAKARINPNGATKALVMWAGQKMTNATIGVIFEHSISSSATAGAIAVFGPGADATSRYLWRSSGSASATATLNGFPAPDRHVFLGQSSILVDSVTSAINGIADAFSTADQGTGTYTEQDTYFASRGGTTLFANMREYAPPLIIFMQTADPGLSVAQLKRLQRKYAKAVGVTL